MFQAALIHEVGGNASLMLPGIESRLSRLLSVLRDDHNFTSLEKVQHADREIRDILSVIANIDPEHHERDPEKPDYSAEERLEELIRERTEELVHQYLKTSQSIPAMIEAHQEADLRETAYADVQAEHPEAYEAVRQARAARGTEPISWDSEWRPGKESFSSWLLRKEGIV